MAVLIASDVLITELDHKTNLYASQSKEALKHEHKVNIVHPRTSKHQNFQWKTALTVAQPLRCE